MSTMTDDEIKRLRDLADEYDEGDGGVLVTALRSAADDVERLTHERDEAVRQIQVAVEIQTAADARADAAEADARASRREALIQVLASQPQTAAVSFGEYERGHTEGIVAWTRRISALMDKEPNND